MHSLAVRKKPAETLQLVHVAAAIPAMGLVVHDLHMLALV